MAKIDEKKEETKNGAKSELLEKINNNFIGAGTNIK